MTRLSMLAALLFAFGCSGDDLDVAMFAIDADVNGDGVVDDGDLHDLHAGLAATHHECAAPDHHDTEGNHVPDHHGRDRARRHP